VEERLDLGEPAVDADDPRGTLGQEVVTEAAPAVHLDEQAAELTERFLARLQERASLAPKQSGVRTTRRNPLGIWRASAEERRHARESS
jgi:hypothetical protein